eukprot:7016804-Lingulodinium_polyedra.AAC.1
MSLSDTSTRLRKHGLKRPAASLGLFVFGSVVTKRIAAHIEPGCSASQGIANQRAAARQQIRPVPASPPNASRNNS